MLGRRRPRRSSGKWASGPMLCLNCGYDEAIHVWLVGSEPVECSECGEMTCVPLNGEGFGDIPFGIPFGSPFGGGDAA